MFVISESVCPLKTLQHSLMYVGKARSLPYSCAIERCFTLGQALALLAKKETTVNACQGQILLVLSTSLLFYG
jgi:hypothetical protein